eukprot:3614000-Alexandrium_andersonii.AAC.1
MADGRFGHLASSGMSCKFCKLMHVILLYVAPCLCAVTKASSMRLASMQNSTIHLFWVAATTPLLTTAVNAHMSPAWVLVLDGAGAQHTGSTYIYFGTRTVLSCFLVRFAIILKFTMGFRGSQFGVGLK